jgi:hypothetical protein
MTDIAREITTHAVTEADSDIKIIVADERGPGNANHLYVIATDGGKNRTTIKFQEGAIKEVGINGISNEALIAVVMDRLEGFQSGPFKNPENEDALNHLRDAMICLQSRTRRRIAQGTEGLSKEIVGTPPSGPAIHH